jgi:hypothetical protein
MDGDLSAIIVVAVCAAACGAFLIGARRFAKRRQREGLWNADGPIDPSPPPPGWNGVPAYNSPPPTIETEYEDENDDDNPPDMHRDHNR